MQVERVPEATLDAGVTVDATFEVVTDAGRITGTRITLRNDAGVVLSGLTDDFGLRPTRSTCTTG